MGYSKTLAGLSSGLDVKAPNRVLNWTARSAQSADIPFKFRYEFWSGRRPVRVNRVDLAISNLPPFPLIAGFRPIADRSRLPFQQSLGERMVLRLSAEPARQSCSSGPQD